MLPRLHGREMATKNPPSGRVAVALVRNGGLELPAPPPRIRKARARGGRVRKMVAAADKGWHEGKNLVRVASWRQLCGIASPVLVNKFTTLAGGPSYTSGAVF